MITFDISNLGINFRFSNIAQDLYNIYGSDFRRYFDDEILSYIKTGQISKNYVITKMFDYLGEIYDKSSSYLALIGIILLSEKINLDTQDDESLFAFILFIMDNELYVFLFQKLREKLSDTKKMSITNRYYQDLRSGRYHGEDQERIVYYNEICNLLLE
jgi:hypothetical protein